ISFGSGGNWGAAGSTLSGGFSAKTFRFGISEYRRLVESDTFAFPLAQIRTPKATQVILLRLSLISSIYILPESTPLGSFGCAGRAGRVTPCGSSGARWRARSDAPYPKPNTNP